MILEYPPTGEKCIDIGSRMNIMVSPLAVAQQHQFCLPNPFDTCPCWFERRRRPPEVQHSNQHSYFKTQNNSTLSFCGFRDLHTKQDLNIVFDPVPKFRVCLEQSFNILAALSQSFTFVREPGSALFNDLVI